MVIMWHLIFNVHVPYMVLDCILIIDDMAGYNYEGVEVYYLVMP